MRSSAALVGILTIAIAACAGDGPVTSPPDGAPPATSVSGLYRLDLDLVNLTARIQPVPADVANGLALHALLEGTAITVSTPTTFSKPGNSGVFEIQASITNNTSLTLGADQHLVSLQGVRTVFTSVTAAPSGTARLSNADGFLSAGPYVTTADPLLAPGQTLIQSWGFEASQTATSVSAIFYITAETEVPTPPQSGSVFLEVLAGGVSPGFNDGFGAAALFNTPLGIDFDAIGDLYVADFSNNAVRVVTGLEDVIGGTGGRVLTVASLAGPHDVAIGPDDDLFAVSFSQGTLVHIEQDRDAAAFGTVTVLASGLAGPIGIAVDAGGNLYVSEFGANRVLRFRRLNNLPANQPAAYAAPVAIATINGPDGIAYSDHQGTIFVSSRADTDVVELGLTGGEVARRDAVGIPFGLDTDVAGSAFFVEGANLSVVNVAGSVLSISAGSFTVARGVAVRSDGAVAVSDSHRIRLVHRRITAP